MSSSGGRSERDQRALLRASPADGDVHERGRPRLARRARELPVGGRLQRQPEPGRAARASSSSTFGSLRRTARADHGRDDSEQHARDARGRDRPAPGGPSPAASTGRLPPRRAAHERDGQQRNADLRRRDRRDEHQRRAAEPAEVVPRPAHLRARAAARVHAAARASRARSRSVATNATRLLIAAAIVGAPASLPSRPLRYDCTEIAPPASTATTSARRGLATSLRRRAGAPRPPCPRATA